MKVWLFLLTFLTGAGALLWSQKERWLSDPGFIVIGYQNWSVEMTLLFFLIALFFSFLGFYLLLRILFGTLNLPRILRRRGGEARSRRSQKALLEGLIESAEGNWEKAEKSLIRHAADSGTPLINYLTAARAAHSRGDATLRDEYFQLARDSTPEAGVAIELTKAELLLSDEQFEEAISSLTQLKEVAPGHATILKMMHKIYTRLEDWEALHHLLPSLHANKVLMEADIRILEAKTHSAQIKKATLSGDVEALKAMWSKMPSHVRNSAGMEAEYYAALIKSGMDGTELETLLRKSLDKRWDETVLVLYGNLMAASAEAQLRQIEKWLKKRPQDAILLRTAAVLAKRSMQAELARDYLLRSTQLLPTVESYQLLGDLHLETGDSRSAAEFFRQGLILASEEVITQIDHNPEAVASDIAPDTEE